MERVDPKDSVPGYEAQPLPGDVLAALDRSGFPCPGDVVLLGEWPNDDRAGYCFPLQAYQYEPMGRGATPAARRHSPFCAACDTEAR